MAELSDGVVNSRSARRTPGGASPSKPDDGPLFEGDVAINEAIALPGYNCKDIARYIMLATIERAKDGSTSYTVSSNFMGSNIEIESGIPITFSVIGKSYQLLVKGDGPIHLTISPVK